MNTSSGNNEFFNCLIAGSNDDGKAIFDFNSGAVHFNGWYMLGPRMHGRVSWRIRLARWLLRPLMK